MERIFNYIDGKLIAPASGSWFHNIDPSTGNIYSEVPDSTAADVDLAVNAATAAFPAWSVMPALTRCMLLEKIAALIERDLELLAKAESVDNGKPVLLARRMDIPRAAENFRFFATASTIAAAPSFNEAVRVSRERSSSFMLWPIVNARG